MTTTLERLSALLLRDYPLSPEQLTPDAPLDALGIDSLGTVELLWQVEDTFQIQLPPEPPALATLGDVAYFVDALVARQHAGRAGAPANDAPAP